MKLLSPKSYQAKIMATVLLSACLHSFAYADMRCGTGLVAEGDSTYEVQRKCGTPAHREVFPANPGHNRAKWNHAATIENWIYGPRNGASYQLKFINGKLVAIDLSR
jgi:hypothetical protein